MPGKPQEKDRTFVPRITQLDANEFDKEIRHVLFTQLMEVSKYLKPGALNSTKSEVNLIIDLLIFHYSVVLKNATFGQELLSLKYSKGLSKKQLIIYALLKYILPYLKDKYEYYFNRLQSIPASIRKSVDKLEVLILICGFLNTLIFLREGKYPTIAERFLKLTYSSINNRTQPIGYNYMTRELLWHGFMELLMCILPLVNYKTIQRKIRQPFTSKSSEVKCEKNIVYDSETKCVVCNDFPTLPCQISVYCSHLGCYYCIESNLLADDKFICPVCGVTNTAKENFKFLTG